MVLRLGRFNTLFVFVLFYKMILSKPVQDTLSETDVDFLTEKTPMKDREAIQLQFKSFLTHHPRGCITKKDFRSGENSIYSKCLKSERFKFELD